MGRATTNLSPGVFIPLPETVMSLVVTVQAHAEYLPSSAGEAIAYSVLLMGVVALLRALLAKRVPRISILPGDDAESSDIMEGRKVFNPDTVTPMDKARPGEILCWDPCTMQDLGTVKSFTAVRCPPCRCLCCWDPFQDI